MTPSPSTSRGGYLRGDGNHQYACEECGPKPCASVTTLPCSQRARVIAYAKYREGHAFW